MQKTKTKTKQNKSKTRNKVSHSKYQQNKKQEGLKATKKTQNKIEN